MEQGLNTAPWTTYAKDTADALTYFKEQYYRTKSQLPVPKKVQESPHFLLSGSLDQYRQVEIAPTFLETPPKEQVPPPPIKQVGLSPEEAASMDAANQVVQEQKLELESMLDAFWAQTQEDYTANMQLYAKMQSQMGQKYWNNLVLMDTERREMKGERLVEKKMREAAEAKRIADKAAKKATAEAEKLAAAEAKALEAEAKAAAKAAAAAAEDEQAAATTGGTTKKRPTRYTAPKKPQKAVKTPITPEERGFFEEFQEELAMTAATEKVVQSTEQIVISAQEAVEITQLVDKITRQLREEAFSMPDRYYG